MKRSDRIKLEIDSALQSAVQDVTGNMANVSLSPMAAAALDRARVHILDRLSKISVVPDYVPVDGVDYTPDGISDIRFELTRARDAAKQQNQHEWVFILDHTLALLSLLIEVMKEHSDVG